LQNDNTNKTFRFFSTIATQKLKENKKGKEFYFFAFASREDRIRTCDPLVPNQVRYRPALLPDPFLGGQK
jgi:hypothetical protein